MNPSFTNIKKQFDEEQLIRSPLASYTLKQLLSMREDILKLSEEELKELEKLSEESLEKNQQNAYAWYSIILSRLLKGQSADDKLERFFSLLQQAQKGAILQHLCEEVLEHNESYFVLSTLAQQYQKQGQNEELIDILKRQLKIDIKDYLLAQKIASLLEKTSKPEEAARYYRMAMFRALEVSDDVDAIKIWKKLIELEKGNFSFFCEWAPKMAKKIPSGRKAQIFEAMFINLEENKENKPSELIEWIKIMIDNGLDNEDLRPLVTQCFRTLYENHSQVESFLNISGLGRNKKNKPLKEQIHFFEEHIQFDIGKFVEHKSFGVGEIKEIQNGQPRDPINTTRIIIDWVKKKNHAMTLRIATSSLKLLPDTNLKALFVFNREKLNEMVKENAPAMAVALLQTFNKPVSSSDIKTLFVPKLVHDEDWAGFWKKLKANLNEHPEISLKSKLYSLNEGRQNIKQKTLNQFYSAKSPLKKLQIFENFLVEYPRAVDEIKELKQHWSDLASSGKGEERLFACLALSDLHRQHSSMIHKNDIGLFFQQLPLPEDLPDFFEQLTSTARFSLIELLFKSDKPQANTVLFEIFFTESLNQKKHLLQKLMQKEKSSILEEIVLQVKTKYSSYPKHLLILSQLILSKHRFDLISQNELFHLLVLALESSYKKTLESDEKHTKGKAYNQIHHLLFEDGHLFDYLKQEAEKTEREQIFKQLGGYSFLEGYLKTEIKDFQTKLAS